MCGPDACMPRGTLVNECRPSSLINCLYKLNGLRAMSDLTDKLLLHSELEIFVHIYIYTVTL